MDITNYKSMDQPQVKKFVLGVLAEFGFPRKPEWDYDLEDPQKYYSGTGGVFYIIKNKESIIGTIAIKNKGEGVAELKRFYIDKNYRGKGYGSQLVDKALEFCRKNKFKKIILDTWNYFDIAMKLYEKRGFRVIGEEKVDDKRCTIFMEKII